MLKTILITSILSSASFAATIIPFERELPRLNKYDFVTSQYQSSDFYSDDFAGDKDENLYKQGFSLINMGPNDIVTTTPQNFEFPNRNFSFVTDDGSRRETYLWLTDSNGSGSVSDYFETAMVFLPRENQMHIEESGESLIVTLTTGEEVIFDKNQRTVKGGVFSEGTLDMTENRAQRSHARIKYTGKGIVIRSDSNGSDPRLAKTLQVMKTGLTSCKLPSSTFWTQENWPKFKYATDQEVYAVITAKCGKKYLP